MAELLGENQHRLEKELNMNTMSIWNPIHEMDSLFHDRLGSFLGGGAEWSPLVDIKETDGEYLICAELPGLSKDNVKVTVEDGVLMLSGARELDCKMEGQTFHRVERSHGSFSRSFTLPEGADGESVKANYRDGLLEVSVAKREDAKPKAIEVRVE
jgi:HSP20 family protein